MTKENKNYYIHPDKTIEFIGTHPVVNEKTILDIAYTLSTMEDPEDLTELLGSDPRFSNDKCKEHGIEFCNCERDDTDFDNARDRQLEDGVI